MLCFLFSFFIDCNFNFMDQCPARNPYNCFSSVFPIFASGPCCPSIVSLNFPPPQVRKIIQGGMGFNKYVASSATTAPIRLPPSDDLIGIV